MKRVTPIKLILAAAAILLVVVVLVASTVAPLVNLRTENSVASRSGSAGSAGGAASAPSKQEALSPSSEATPAGGDADASGTKLPSIQMPAGAGGEATTSPGARVQGTLLDQPPVLDAKTRALQESEANAEEEHIDPLTPLDKNPVVKTVKPETQPVEAPREAQVLDTSATTQAPASSAAAFYYYQTHLFDGGASMIGEASHASNSIVVLETYNWGAGLSMDGGKTFRYLNPYTLFPASYGGFCCDQVVYYDQAHDIMFWILQYSPNASGNNAIRLAWANGLNRLANADFCYTDFTPQQLGSPSGTNYDQPKFARSNNDIYMEMTQYGAAGGSIVLRAGVSQFTTGCGGVGYQWYSPGLFSPGFTQRAYDTMYFAAHVSNSKLRVFAWPESVSWNAITTHDVSHTAYPQHYPYSCPRTGGSSTSDWCQRRSFGGGWAHSDRIFTAWMTGGYLFFTWDASQGNNGVGGPTFAYPYLHIVRIRQSDFTLQGEPIQWSSGFAMQYAAAALNDRLNVAGTVMWGGGSYYENCANFIWDDLSTGYAPGNFGWEWYSATSSNIDPNDKLSGDYLATRRNGLNGYTWSGSCYALRNDGPSNTVSVHPYYSWFGRARDYTIIRSVFVPMVRR